MIAANQHDELGRQRRAFDAANPDVESHVGFAVLAR
jgi:hypothetical protein